MADLNFYANIAEILGTLTIIGGGVFGAVQLLEFRGQRRDAVAIELMRSLYNPEFSRAELTGGLLEMLWRKLGVWVVTTRTEQSHPRFAEWFEWLAIQFAKPDNSSEPAHLAYRQWKP